jgi:2-oxoglutarate ferredoxin oxidoreductase subunit beta
MTPLASLEHDWSNRLRALELAQEYGRKLYTGVFYKDPSSVPTYEQLVAERQQTLGPEARPRAEILDMFVPR